MATAGQSADKYFTGAQPSTEAQKRDLVKDIAERGTQHLAQATARQETTDALAQQARAQAASNAPGSPDAQAALMAAQNRVSGAFGLDAAESQRQASTSQGRLSDANTAYMDQLKAAIPLQQSELEAAVAKALALNAARGGGGGGGSGPKAPKTPLSDDIINSIEGIYQTTPAGGREARSITEVGPELERMTANNPRGAAAVSSAKDTMALNPEGVETVEAWLQSMVDAGQDANSTSRALETMIGRNFPDASTDTRLAIFRTLWGMWAGAFVNYDIEGLGGSTSASFNLRDSGLFNKKSAQSGRTPVPPSKMGRSLRDAVQKAARQARSSQN